MTLQRFAKWWSLAALVAVLVAVVATYMDANADGHLPLSLTGAQKTALLVWKIALSAMAVALAVVVTRIT